MKKNTDSKKTQDYIFDLTDFNAVHFDYMDNYCMHGSDSVRSEILHQQTIHS